MTKLSDSQRVILSAAAQRDMTYHLHPSSNLAAVQTEGPLVISRGDGVYVIAFSFPVVPKGQARIRVQMSAVHDRVHLEKAVAAFTQAGRELGLVK